MNKQITLRDGWLSITPEVDVDIFILNGTPYTLFYFLTLYWVLT